ncbi:MAG: hypothetical protein CMI60_08730 [Parvibaculum sp.]|nr:hypothetical protein [Parvibaculum sp.]
MNDDLILRARLDAQGYSKEEIQKEFSLNPAKWGAGPASSKLTDRLPGGAKRQDKRMGQEGFTANNKAMITGQKQVDAQQAYADKMGAKGYETMTSVPSGMTSNTVTGNVAGGPPGNISMSPADAMRRGMTTGMPQQPVADNSVTGNNAQADQVKTETTMGADGGVAETKTTEVMNANADTTGESGGDVTVQDATSQDSTGTGAATQTAPQQQQAQGQGGVNPQVQGMAQQFQAGQDMQTIQQGKGGENQSWLKNRSGMGKLLDIATFGATSRFGSTGGAARGKANQQSQQQTQNYQAANQRMNQRAMGMNAPMVATSFDSQLSAYSDVLSLRKSIQERNTTTNLRR